MKLVFLISGFFILVTFIAKSASQRPVSELSTNKTASEPNPAAFIDGYKNWNKVNPKPHKVFSTLAIQCMAPTREQQQADADNPHLDSLTAKSIFREKYVTVYVNKLAEDSMLHQAWPSFPKGSIIVKEKLTKPDSDAPELLTVMLKRQEGYNPIGGDWEYLVFDGAGKNIQAQGKLKKCQSCHEQWKKTDFISRAYLDSAAIHSLH